MNIMRLLGLTGADTIRCSPIHHKGELLGYKFIALYTPHSYISYAFTKEHFYNTTEEQLAEKLKNEPQS